MGSYWKGRLFCWRAFSRAPRAERVYNFFGFDATVGFQKEEMRIEANLNQLSSGEIEVELFPGCGGNCCWEMMGLTGEPLRATLSASHGVGANGWSSSDSGMRTDWGDGWGFGSSFIK
jgi:hypothetical protein